MNSTDDSSDESAGQALLNAGLVIAIVGVVLDSVTLHVLRVTKFSSGRPAAKLTLASLCVANLFQAVATVLVIAANHVQNAVRDDKSCERSASCARHVFELLWVCAVHGNLLTLVIMAIEQFICVRWPLSSDRWLTVRVLGGVVAFAWIVSVAVGIAIPIIVVAAVTKNDQVSQWESKGTTRFCYQYIVYHALDGFNYTYDFGQAAIERALVSVAFGIIIIAFVVLTVTYAYMFVTVRKIIRLRHVRHRMAAPASQEDRGRGSDRSGSRRVIVATFFVTVTFLAYYLPLLVYNAMQKFGVFPKGAVVYSACFAVAALTTVTDPLIYSWRLQEMRMGLRRLVKTYRTGFAAAITEVQHLRSFSSSLLKRNTDVAPK